MSPMLLQIPAKRPGGQTDARGPKQKETDKPATGNPESRFTGEPR